MKKPVRWKDKIIPVKKIDREVPFIKDYFKGKWKPSGTGKYKAKTN